MKIFAKESALVPSWDLLSPSVALLKKNIWSVLYLSFLPGLFISVGSIMTKDIHNFSHLQNHQMIGGAILGIAFLWTVLTYPGYIYMQAQATRGLTIAPGEAFRHGLRRFFPLAFTIIIGGILTLIGFLCFILPGLTLLRMYILSQYFAVDQKMGPLAALKASDDATSPVSAWIWGVLGVTFVFAILSFLLNFIPVVGSVVGSIVGFFYAFAAPLRYNEIVNGINPLQFVSHKSEA